MSLSKETYNDPYILVGRSLFRTCIRRAPSPKRKGTTDYSKWDKIDSDDEAPAATAASRGGGGSSGGGGISLAYQD